MDRLCLSILLLTLPVACHNDDDDGGGDDAAETTAATTSSPDDDTDTSADADADAGGTVTECTAARVATCLVADSSCVDLHGPGFVIDDERALCEMAGGTLSETTACDPAQWVGGCVLDRPELDRCKVTWKNLPADVLQSACEGFYVPGG